MRSLDKLSPFFRANLTMGITTFVRFALNICKTKVSAYLLGAYGVGIIGLVQQVQMLGSVAGSMSIGPEFTRLLSKFRAEKNDQEKYSLLNSAFTIILLLNAFFTVVILLGAPLAAKFMLGDHDKAVFLLPALVAIPFQSFTGCYLYSIYFVYGRLKFLTIASVSALFFETFLYIVFVKYFGIMGALWAVSIGCISTSLSLLYFMGKFENLKLMFRFSINRTYVKELFKSGIIMSAAGLVTYFVNSMIRLHIIRTNGGSSGGLYHVVQVFSAYYFPYFTNGIWARLFPKVSAEKISDGVEKEWLEAILFISMFSTIVQGGILAFSKMAIHILYTPEFLPAASMVPTQMVADYLYLIAQPGMAILLGLAHMRLYLLVTTIYSLLLLGLTVVLTKKFGVAGAPYAYLTCAALLSTFMFGLFLVKAKSRQRKMLSIFVLFISISFILINISLARGFAPVEERIGVLILGALGSIAVYFVPKIKKHFFI